MNPHTSLPEAPARRWFHEPLLHFALVGALMFGAYAWLNRGAPLADADRQIVLTEDDLLQMRLVWRAQGRAEPTPAQLKDMIEAKVREEVLYREARAMGLENDDVIVKRRLAQKMDFLAEDLASLREPSRDELVAWLEAHPQDFAVAPRASFHHVYFSFDRRQDKAREAASAAMAQIAARKSDGAARLGDPFMFQDRYAERTPEQIASVFGGPFAKALFEAAPGAWAGPIESAFGWHLVFVDALTPRRVPHFDEIERDVKAAWIQQQRVELKRHAYEFMRAKYRVVVPAGETAAGSITPAPAGRS